MRLGPSLHDKAADALTRLLRGDRGHAELALCIVGRVRRGQAESALGNLAHAPPLAWNHLEDLLDELLRGPVAFPLHRPGVLVFHLRAAFLQLLDHHVDPLENVQGLEAGDHDGDLVLAGQRLVLPEPHHSADVAGGEKALHLIVGRREDGLHGRGHQHMGGQDGEIGKSLLFGLIDRHSVGRRGGLEAYSEEDHLPIRVGLGQLHRVQRGVDNAHVTAGGLHRKEVAGCARHPEHIAEGAEDHLGTPRDLQRLVDELDRGHADWTAGTVDQADARRQQFIDAEAHDGVGLAATDFHECPRTGGDAMNGLRVAAGRLWIPILINEFHPESASNSDMCVQNGLDIPGMGDRCMYNLRWSQPIPGMLD